MSDLSRVLGDLYGDNEPTTTAPSTYRPTAPEWANEDRLDEAFASWTPGPPPEAPAAEREMSVVIDAPDLPAARLDEDLAATLSAALVDAGQNEVEFPVASAPSYALPTYDDEPMPAPMAPVEAYVPEPEPVPVAPAPKAYRPWSRSDDDVIPGAAGKTPKVKAPKVKAAKGVKSPKAPKVKTPKVKAPKAPKAEKPAKVSDGPKKFFGIELTFKRSK